MERRRVVGWLASGALLAGGAAWLRRPANRYYQGPPSPHFDGTRFFNPLHPDPKGFQDLLRWQMSGERVTWPASVPSPFVDRPPPRVGGDGLRVSYVGHASFLLQTAGLNILLDPVWSQRASPVSFAGPSRVNAPGIPFEALPPVDLVLVSHNHYDHLDLDTLERLHAAHQPHFVTPLGNDTILRGRIPALRVTAGDWHDVVEIAPGLRVHLEPALHWSARSWNDRSHALWAAFVLETPGGSIYLVGDTGFGDGETFRRVGARHPGLRTALLPIGAYEPRWFMQSQHMNPHEAVRALQLCGARTAIAHHWGTFQLTDEGVHQPVEELGRALVEQGVDGERFRVLRPGEVWEEGG